MNALVDPTTPGLAAYYRFDEIDGTTVFDQTSNGNNGVLGGGVPPTSRPTSPSPVPSNTTFTINLLQGNNPTPVMQIATRRAERRHLLLDGAQLVDAGRQLHHPDHARRRQRRERREPAVHNRPTDPGLLRQRSDGHARRLHDRAGKRRQRRPHARHPHGVDRATCCTLITSAPATRSWSMPGRMSWAATSSWTAADSGITIKGYIEHADPNL